MEIITSSQNQFVKLASSLLDKKGRDESGLFLAEGINLLRDMPDYVEVLYIFTNKNRQDECASIINKHEGAKVFIVEDHILNKISDTKTPYGIVAVCKQMNNEFALPLGNALLLDNVSDAGNVGTIIRTAAAAGFEDIYLYNSVDVYSPKVIRSTLGGIFKVRIYNVSLEQAQSLITKTNSAMLDMSGSNILDEKLSAPITLIMGSEAHGISKEIKEKVAKTISIPMKNNVESLNVSVAAAIAMYSVKGV